MKSGLLVVQAFTYLALGTALASEGMWKLAVSQYLLAGVQVLIYS